MELERLREYVELVRFGNYSKAARYLNTSQSTLSKHIQSLEKELECTLVERGGRPLHVTEAGRILFDTATKMINMYTECENQLKRARRKDALCILGRTNAAPVQNLLEEFDREYGSRFVTNVLDDGNCPLDVSILQNQADAAFSPYPSGQRNVMTMFAFHRIAHDRMIAVVSSENELAQCKSVWLEDLSKMVLVRVANGFSADPGWRVIEECCNESGFRPLSRTHFLSDGDVHLKENEVLVLPQCELESPTAKTLLAEGVPLPIRNRNAYMDIFLITKAGDDKSEGARLLEKTARALYPSEESLA